MPSPKSPSRRRFLQEAATTGALLASGLLPRTGAEAAPPQAQEASAISTKQTPKEALSWEDVVGRHPAAPALRRLFPMDGRSQIKPTGLTRADYLPVIAGIVDFFRGHQNAAGAIIDPYEGREIQYSTPAFAAASALLIREAGRDDLLDPAMRALSFALQALLNRTAADGHADFYIPLIMHARRWLAGKATAAQEADWAATLSQLIPERVYQDTRAAGNWNLVNVAGECLRRRDGLVSPEQRDEQMAYIERSLARQQHGMTRYGMYEDPNAPLAYDIFPRLWMEDVLQDGAYDGAHRAQWQEFLTQGGLSTLLLLSPSGEWPCGGRSAHHQWNEAAVAVVCEANAVRWKAWGRPDVAGAFSRAAHLALTSLRRWRRPSGELWIVKNRADPKLRHGYETYSFHSQYNLLPAAMLAIAYSHADPSISETAVPAETGSYVFDLRETFHKVCACAGGTYALIDTGADPHYDASGLMRVHRAGVSLSAFSDNTAADRAYGPPQTPSAAIAPGAAWSAAGRWSSLANFTDAGHAGRGGPRTVRTASLEETAEKKDRASFTLRYELSGDGARPLEEQYTVSADGVSVVSTLTGDDAPGATRVVLPILVSDGAEETHPAISLTGAFVPFGQGRTVWEIVSPASASLALTGPSIPSHNGWVRAAIADLPPGTRAVHWKLHLS